MSRRPHRRGFSLIEILIAILIIGILMAVAASNLLGARGAGEDSAAQQQLSAAKDAAFSAFVNRGNNYGGATAANLQDDVGDVPLVAGAASVIPDTSVRQVSVATSSGDTVWTAAALGGDGRCWFITMNDKQQTRYGLLEGQTSCDASTQAPAAWVEFAYPPAE